MLFETNVFINCPFDDDYVFLLRPLIFTILYLDLEPKIAQVKSSSHIRVNQIKQHIRESRFSIHDLSRSKPLKGSELPRFNMPYELGLDIGCLEFGDEKYRQKRILVLETEKYHYQKVLSDMAGQDIENHNDDPKTLVKKVRNWFSANDEIKSYPGANKIWLMYNQFYEDLKINLLADGYTATEVAEMPTADFIKFAKDWIEIIKS